MSYSSALSTFSTAEARAKFQKSIHKQWHAFQYLDTRVDVTRVTVVLQRERNRCLDKVNRVVNYLESNLMRQDWIIFSSLVLLGEVKDRDVLR